VTDGTPATSKIALNCSTSGTASAARSTSRGCRIRYPGSAVGQPRERADVDAAHAEPDLVSGDQRVSHQTIYLSLFVQARGALRKELFRCLRTGRARRRSQGLTVNNGQGKIRGMVGIAERPAEAGDRAVPGH